MHWAEVFFYSIAHHGFPSDRQLLLSVLDYDERQRFERFKFDHSRWVYASSRYFLKTEIAKKVHRQASEIRFRYNENGKPFLDTKFNLHFSLSHTNDGVAFCLSNEPVGIDIEIKSHKGEPWTQPSAFLNENVGAHVEKIADENDKISMFYRYWTLLEAKVKLHGSTLYTHKESFVLPQSLVRDNTWIDDKDIFVTNTIENMQWALCCHNKPDTMKTFEFSDDGICLESNRLLA